MFMPPAESDLSPQASTCGARIAAQAATIPTTPIARLMDHLGLRKRGAERGGGTNRYSTLPTRPCQNLRSDAAYEEQVLEQHPVREGVPLAVGRHRHFSAGRDRNQTRRIARNQFPPHIA